MTRVAFIAFKLKDRDPVSIETEKWIRIFDNLGFHVHRIAGYIPEPASNDHIIPDLSSVDPRVEELAAAIFDDKQPEKRISPWLRGLADDIEGRLVSLLDDIDPDLLVVDDVFSLPLNLPFSLVLGRWLAEKKLPCVAVHHDFYWWHDRFVSGWFGDLLVNNFPLGSANVVNVTPDRASNRELYRKTGKTSKIIYSCLDFDSVSLNDPAREGERGRLFTQGVAGKGGDKTATGSGESAPGRGSHARGDGFGTIVLLPAGAWSQASIAGTAEFVRKLEAETGSPAFLVSDGAADNELDPDCPRLDIAGQAFRGAASGAGHVWRRQRLPGFGEADPVGIYAMSNIVILPEASRGMMPVIRAIACRKPVVCVDGPLMDELRELGLQFLTLDGEAVTRVAKLMDLPLLIEEMLERNFEIGRRYFSLESLTKMILELIAPVLLPAK